MKRWWIGLLATSLLGVMIWGTRFVLDPQRFPVSSVQIEGPLQYVSIDELERAVAEQISGNFFQVDLNAVRVAAERLAWVRKVTARRAWPDRLHLKIQERQALAHWVSGGLVDAAGHLFTPQSGTAPVALPLFDGPDGNEAQMLEHYRQFSELLGTDERIKRLMVDERGEWQIELEDGLLLIVGRDDLVARLQRYARAQAVVSAGVDPGHRVEKIDLRYPNGLAVSWTALNVGE